MTAAAAIHLDPAARPLAPPALHPPRDEAGRDRFASTLAAAGARLDREAMLHDAAQKLVSTALVQPLFRAMEKPSFGTEGPLMPGTGERRFMPLLHQHLADRITQAGSFPLVDAVIDQFRAWTDHQPTDGRTP
jgi:Rod binding domain-containing protein